MAQNIFFANRLRYGIFVSYLPDFNNTEYQYIQNTSLGNNFFYYSQQFDNTYHPVKEKIIQLGNIVLWVQ